MKFPDFTDARMVGLSACGQLLSPSKDQLLILKGLHERRPLAAYKSKTGKVLTHILGGKQSKPNHLHIDCFKEVLLKLDGVRAPKPDTTRTSISKDLLLFMGCGVAVTYTGIFLVAETEIQTSGLVKTLKYEKSSTPSYRIVMTSASFQLEGFSISNIKWRLSENNRLRISLSYSIEYVISNLYFVEPVATLSLGLQTFVTGDRPNV